MKINEIIRTIINERGMKYSFLANKMNVSRSVLSERLNMANLSIKKYNEMLEPLDFKLMVVPKSYPPEQNCYEIDVDNDD